MLHLRYSRYAPASTRECVNSTKPIGRKEKAVKISIKSTKIRFVLDRSGYCFIFMKNQENMFWFSFSIVNDMITCQPFRNFWKASKFSGGVKKTKISSTLVVMRLKNDFMTSSL